MAPFAPPLFRAFCASSFFFLSACRGAPSAGWLRSRHDSFCCGPSLGLLLFFSTLFLCFLLRPFCGFCGLHGGALTVCCFFFLCVSSASAVWASRLWWTGFSTSQACTWGSQLSALASVGASRCASPLPLSGFVAGGLRPGEKEGDVQAARIKLLGRFLTLSLPEDPANDHGIEEGGLGGEGLSLSFKLLIRLGNDKPILRTY